MKEVVIQIKGELEDDVSLSELEDIIRDELPLASFEFVSVEGQ